MERQLREFFFFFRFFLRFFKVSLFSLDIGKISDRCEENVGARAKRVEDGGAFCVDER